MPCPNTEYQTLAINCVYLVSVHPPIVPTLKMAVWLCLPCAGGPNSGRKSDAQRPFPRIQDAQSHVCLNYSNSCLHMRKKQNNKTSVHAVRCTAPRHETENISILPGLFRCLFVFWLRYAPIHTDGSHRESRLGGSE